MSELPSVDERNAYTPDGHLNIGMLPLFVIVPFLAAIVTGWLLSLFFAWGWYLIVIVPLGLALIPTGAVYCMVKWSHCRNVILAGGIGVLIGTITYLSSFHFTMISQAPAGLVHRLDLLPQYILFRMNTDIQEDAGAPRPQAAKPSPILNWLMFAFEFTIVAGLPCGAGIAHAKRAYNVELKQWMKKEEILVPAGTSTQLRQALDTGQLETFLQTTKTLQVGQQHVCRLVAEYATPASGSPFDYPIYLTANESSSSFFKKVGQKFRQIELTTAEVLTLRPLFTKLKDQVQTIHPELRQADTTAATIDTRPPLQFATIEEVPFPHGNNMLTTSFLICTNVLGGMPFALWAAAAGAFYGSWFWHETMLLLAVVCGIIGAALVVIGFVQTQRFPMLVESLFIRSQLRKLIRQRPAPIVAADDERSVLVSMTPRENWTKIKLETAADFGLMRLDQQKHELLIECSEHRYRIPGGSILDCQAEPFRHPIDQETENWMVCLQVATQNETRELIFGPSHTEFRGRTNATRQTQIRQLIAQIQNLITESRPS